MVGIKDVAGKAGVSISTVSYVMSGKRPISPATRRRVLAAAREIGYVPAPGEHAARATRTHFVALSSPVHDSTSYTNYFTYFLHFLRQARFHGYETLLLTEENGGEQLARLIDTGLVDGVVLMDVNMDDSRLAVAAATGVPFVSIGLPGADTGIPCVDIDFTLMGGGIIDRLDRLGHSRIMFIGGKHVDYERGGGANYLVRLRSALLDNARCRNIRVDEQYTDEDDFDAIETILDMAMLNGDTAIVSQGGPMFLNSLVAVARKNGIRFPADLCRMGVDMIVRLMDGEPWRGDRVTLIPPVYQRRGSLGAPREPETRSATTPGPASLAATAPPWNTRRAGSLEASPPPAPTAANSRSATTPQAHPYDPTTTMRSSNDNKGADDDLFQP